MPKKYDIVAKNGEYIGKDGTKKTRWLNVGVVWENDNGMYITLDRTFNPAGLPNPENKESCFLSLFPAKESQNRAPQKEPEYSASDFDDTESPF